MLLLTPLKEARWLPHFNVILTLFFLYVFRLVEFRDGACFKIVPMFLSTSEKQTYLTQPRPNG